MARNLLAAGWTVHGYDPDPAAAASRPRLVSAHPDAAGVAHARRSSATSLPSAALHAHRLPSIAVLALCPARPRPA
jgi:3-hydroxyisobutyrate dehydrogenase-like beta-hydroxyacid dehydrogenase